MSIAAHVKGQAHFLYFRDGDLWYQTDSGFKFPVPVADAGTAAFNRDEKAIYFMRWIRNFESVLNSPR